MTSYIKRYFRWRRMRKTMLNRRKVSDRREKLRSNLDKNPVIGILMLLILMGVCIWSMMNRMDIVDVPELVEDQTAPVTIYAKVDFTYIDQQATEESHKKIIQDQPLFFRVKPENIQALETQIKTFAEQQKGENSPGPEFYKQLLEQMLDEAHRGLLSTGDKVKYRDTTIRIIDPKERVLEKKNIRRAYTPEEKAEELSDDLVMKYFPRASWEKEKQKWKIEIRNWLSGVTAEYDQEYTESKRQEAIRRAGNIEKDIQRNEVLIRKGEKVEKRHLEMLETYEKYLNELRNKRKTNVNWIHLCQSFCIAFLLILFTGIYLSHIHPEVTRSSGKICALGLIILAALLLNIFSVKLFAYASEMFSIPPRLWYLALPIGFAPIVIGSLVGVRTALFSGLFISLVAAFSGTQYNSQFDMVVYGMVVSALSSYMIKNCMNYRSLFLKGFFTVTIVSMVLAVVFCWRDGSLEKALPWPLILPVASGIATIVLVQFALFLLELCFDLSSRMSLNLYSDFNHPLLKEMQLKVPGTYHHSLIVSTLAEAAATAIKADPVKARVGALFHDAGKLSNPEHFTENSNGEDHHKDKTPKMSAMVIINHVREGMELARKYKLKRPIRDAIEQHHGTDLVYYFYKQAKDSGECFDEQDFRYSGPRPKTRETAILSLADACEAASRALEKPTYSKIKEMVEAIFHNRLRDGQLDDSSLTFRELTQIRESFIKTLTSMLHARIPYPKEEEPDDENDLFVAAERKAAASQKS